MSKLRKWRKVHRAARKPAARRRVIFDFETRSLESLFPNLYPYQREMMKILAMEPLPRLVIDTGRIPRAPEYQFPRFTRIGETRPVIAFLDVDYSGLEKTILASLENKAEFLRVIGIDLASGPDKSVEVIMEKLDTGETVIREIKTLDIVSRNDPLTELP